MKFDPALHHRRSTRLRGYDYAREGAYFVTLCTKGREPLFGDVIDEEMWLTKVGTIVIEEWERSRDVRAEIDLDAFVVMPNHIHGIVVIDGPPATEQRRGNVGAYGHTPLPKTAFTSPSRTLGAMIRGFKSVATKRINEMRGTPRISVWQRNYHDQIIRNADHLNRVRRYIDNNPRQWALDGENPDGARFGSADHRVE